jgi:hypothetical protein
MSYWEYIWWRFMPGIIVEVRWPVGLVKIRQEESGIWDYVRSADPNDHYRPWLENHVGRQGWDWDWRVGPHAADNGFGTIGVDKVKIKFRKGKGKFATMANLKWA